MRCREKDLALVARSERGMNDGGIVRVLEPSPLPGLAAQGHWLVSFLTTQQLWSDEIDGPVVKPAGCVAHVRDRDLWPLRLYGRAPQATSNRPGDASCAA